MSDKSSASTLRRDYENNITYHGSRFGTGIKQLEPVNDAGHRIMDYSIHDAIEAGFNHVVFIIRKDIEKEFKEVIGDRIASICSAHNVTVDYAFQDINDIPGELPAGRTKPCLCVGRLLRFRQPGECHTAVRKDVVQASHATICVAGRNRDLTDVLAHKGHFTGKIVHDGTKGSTSL